jgi:hypothetical protein
MPGHTRSDAVPPQCAAPPESFRSVYSAAACSLLEAAVHNNGHDVILLWVAETGLWPSMSASTVPSLSAFPLDLRRVAAVSSLQESMPFPKICQPIIAEAVALKHAVTRKGWLIIGLTGSTAAL